MNRQETRAHALQIASNLLDGDTQNSGPFDHLEIGDAEKVVAEVEAISQELERRAVAINKRLNA